MILRRDVDGAWFGVHPLAPCPALLELAPRALELELELETVGLGVDAPVWNPTAAGWLVDVVEETLTRGLGGFTCPALWDGVAGELEPLQPGLGGITWPMGTGGKGGASVKPGAAGASSSAATARDRWARAVLERIAWPAKPTRGMVQTVQAIGRHEGGYGWAWGAPGAGCNNWGAVHHSLPQGGACPPGSFLWASEFNPKTQARYEVCMRCYPSPEAGAAGLLGNLGPKARPLTWAALTARDRKGRVSAEDVAACMYREHYYGGFHKPPEGDARNVAAYADAIFRNATAIAANLGEPLSVVRESLVAKRPPHRTSSGAGTGSAGVLVPLGLGALYLVHKVAA